MASESLLNQLRQSFYDENGTPNARLNQYCSKDIRKIVIDGNEFTGYKTYSFFWEKTYVKEPERSSSGVIGNLNSYATFITPHLQIKFALMSLEDYRRLYNLILSKNEFVVTCYDLLTNDTTTNKMYFYPDSLPKLNMIARNILNPNGHREKWVELIGIEDYVIEMVGTNSQLGGITVQYLPNVPSGVSSSLTGVGVDVSNGQEIYIGKGAETIMNSELVDSNDTKWVFDYWLGSNGVKYQKDSVFIVSQLITLSAQWKQNDFYTLVYNYGIGTPKVDNKGLEVYSKPIKYGEAFGELYQSVIPTVEFNGEKFTSAYTYEGWYYNSQGLGTKIKSTDQYLVKGNTTIYQIIKPKPYTITFNSNGGSSIEPITNDFNSKVAIPTPKKDNQTFKGWFYDEKFNTQFNGLVPPKNVTLYAKWE